MRSIETRVFLCHDVAAFNLEASARPGEAAQRLIGLRNMICSHAWDIEMHGLGSDHTCVYVQLPTRPLSALITEPIPQDGFRGLSLGVSLSCVATSTIGPIMGASSEDD